MEADAGFKAKELAVDGGASQNDWLMQFQSNIIGLPVQRPQMVETTALGAAGLAGISGGMWTTTEDFIGARAEPDVFSPDITRDVRDALLDGWRRAVGTTLHWARSENR
jgi:glycerol kinase